MLPSASHVSYCLTLYKNVCVCVSIYFIHICTHTQTDATLRLFGTRARRKGAEEPAGAGQSPCRAAFSPVGLPPPTTETQREGREGGREKRKKIGRRERQDDRERERERDRERESRGWLSTQP